MRAPSGAGNGYAAVYTFTARAATRALPGRSRGTAFAWSKLVTPVHIVLVPGFFGFGRLGEISYFAGVREVLESALAPVLAVGRRLHCSGVGGPSELPSWFVT
jgi:hypothetical protein